MDALNTKIKNIKTEKALKVRPENIKSGVSIFGINGSVTELNGETATVTPTTSSQTVTPTGAGKNALTSVTVNAVTSSIDNNITAGNIKNGVSILGVTGSYQGTDTSDATADESDILDGKTAYVNGQKINGKLKILEGYTELNYLQSTGTQRISTGVIRTTSNKYRFKGQFYFEDTQTRQATGVQGLVYIGVINGYYQIAQGGTTRTDVVAPENTWVDFDVTFDTPNYTCSYTVNGTSGTMSSIGYSNVPPNERINIFSLNDQVLPCSCKISYFQIYVDDVLTRDYIPVIRKSDGEPCMFDKVTKEFYTNYGTGDFLYG